MLKSALLLTTGAFIGAAAISITYADMTQRDLQVAINADAFKAGTAKAATLPVYAVFEANITDEATYAKAVPDADKIVRENGGSRIAGGFNKAKLISGKTELGNRNVIPKLDSEEGYAKAGAAGVQPWVAKTAPGARQVMVPGIE